MKKILLLFFILCFLGCEYEPVGDSGHSGLNCVVYFWAPEHDYDGYAYRACVSSTVHDPALFIYPELLLTADEEDYPKPSTASSTDVCYVMTVHIFPEDSNVLIEFDNYSEEYNHVMNYYGSAEIDNDAGYQKFLIY